MDYNIISKIIYLGAYRFSRTIEIDFDSAIREAVYCFYNRKELLPHQILLAVSEYSDEYYRGYSSDNYAEFEVDELRPLFQTDKELRSILEDWYRVRQVLKLLGLEMDIREVLRCSEEYKALLEEDKPVFFRINSDFMLNRYASREKTEVEDRVCLAMYFGILSIIGSKDYACTTSDMIKMRTFGVKNEEELKELCKDTSFCKMYKRYTSRRAYSRIIEKLQIDGLVSEVGANKKTYISVKMNREQLFETASKDSLKYKRQELAREKEKLKLKYFSVL